jgi:predicted MPP superfamily phosphohydrolase
MAKKTVIKRISVFIILIIFALIMVWVIWGNKALEVNRYTIVSQRLAKEFDGFTVAHLSDLHNEEIKGVIPALKEADPDIIVITGDIIDGKDMDITLPFTQEVAKIAPCYYVTGNHESRVPQGVYAHLEEGLTEAGITVLHDENFPIEKDGKTISLIGIDDPSFRSYVGTKNPINQSLITALKEENTFTILLSHRPELFDVYVESDVDLVLSGHAHGGQVRIPFIGGIVAPNQGLFPQYDAGLFAENNTHMIVSRGIGNGTVVPRVNNRPEVIFIELQSAES